MYFVRRSGTSTIEFYKLRPWGINFPKSFMFSLWSSATCNTDILENRCEELLLCQRSRAFSTIKKFPLEVWWWLQILVTIGEFEMWLSSTHAYLANHWALRPNNIFGKFNVPSFALHGLVSFTKLRYLNKGLHNIWEWKTEMSKA